ncbi:hypothetical protein Tco_1266009 [Tanacetum coccineum]
MFVIEQPISPAPTADSTAQVLADWNAVYDTHNKVAYLMLRSMTPKLHRQFENSSPYEMLQELKFMFEKQAGVESVGLIMNGLTGDFAGFVRNYNMHNIGKMIGVLHALLIEYEKGLPKKVATPQVMAIQGGRIKKANKKSLNAKGKVNEEEEEASWHCQFFQAADHVVAPTPGSTITILETANEFAIKGNAPKLPWSQSVQRNHYKNILSWSQRNNPRSSKCRIRCNTQPNPKGHNSKAYQPSQSRNEHVNAVFTRSGKSYNPPVNPNDQRNNSETPINFDSDDEAEEPTP